MVGVSFIDGNVGWNWAIADQNLKSGGNGHVFAGECPYSLSSGPHKRSRSGALAVIVSHTTVWTESRHWVGDGATWSVKVFDRSSGELSADFAQYRHGLRGKVNSIYDIIWGPSLAEFLRAEDAFLGLMSRKFTS